MFDLRWARPDDWAREPAVPPSPSRLRPGDVERVLHLVWEEHCTECAIPDCYSTCSLYERRADGQCARFRYGIAPNPSVSGHFTIGADIRFKRWGKLEAAIRPLSRSTPVVAHGLDAAAEALPLWMHTRIGRWLGPERFDFDDFVLECINPSTVPVRLVLSYTRYPRRADGTEERHLVLRHAVTLEPGLNHHTVPAGDFHLESSGFISLEPEDADQEPRLVFTWLDFVKYRRRPAAAQPAPAPEPERAALVKCLAWDLDQTVWDGILVETADPASLGLRPGVRETIVALDERGVIQTIVSRNDHAQAWAQLERLGIAEYFVYPAINWGQKSENLKHAAGRINIGLDACAFVDDSAMQRAEVGRALPQVRVYAETDLPGLLARPEFQLPITEASRSRRQSYRASMQRDDVQASFTGDYDAFLLSCEMRIALATPRGEEVRRCWELVQRTNQLNLSGRRYDVDAFAARVAEPGVAAIALGYRDRFGDYGTVGFATVDLRGPHPALTDFVLSCRVAQQRVEHQFLEWLVERLGTLGHDRLVASVARTAKNGPLRQVFVDLPFEVLREVADRQDVQMRVDPARVRPRLATFEVDADVLSGRS